MDNILEITYTIKGGTGCIKLKVPYEPALLSQVEQKLADTGATDIVYVTRPAVDGDFDEVVENAKQLSFFDGE